MGEILVTLAKAGINLGNSYVRGTCGDDLPRASSAWVATCRGICCISVDSRGLRDGQVRYDEPGSMHPMQHAQVTFVPADIDAGRTDGGSTVSYMRRHADRVLLVLQDSHTQEQS
jgi:hypothetical protein